MRHTTNDTVMHLLSQHQGALLLRLIGDERRGVLQATSLAAETIHPDCVWDVGDGVVHLEIETNMRPVMAARLFDYRNRLLRLKWLRGRPLEHHVLVLNAGSPPGRQRSTDTTSEVTVQAGDEILFTYQIHLLRNHEPEPLLTDPETAVFAALAHVLPGQRPAVLRRAIEIITASDHPDRESLIQAAGTLASLRITDRTIIDTTIREAAAMPIDLSETAYYRDAEARGLARGRAEGEATGRAEGEAVGRLLGMLELHFGRAGADVSDQVIDQLSRQPDPARLILGAASFDDLVRQLTG